MFKDDYKEIMDEVKVTEAMKQRLMSNLTDPEIINKKNRFDFTKFIYRFTPVAACLLVVVLVLSNNSMFAGKKDVTVNPTLTSVQGKSNTLSIEVEGEKIVIEVAVNEGPSLTQVAANSSNDFKEAVTNQMEVCKDDLWYLYTSDKDLNMQQWEIVLSYIESME